MSIFLILPTQLFKNINILKEYDIIYLIEDPYYINKISHKQKIVLHIASMQYYYNYLLNKLSNKIKYIKYDDINYNKILKNKNITMYHPTDKFIIQQFKSFNIKYLDTPLFLTSIDELNILKKNNKRYNQTEFYKYQRKKYNILLNKQGEPLYNNWTFDRENRERYENEYKELKIKDYNNNYIKYAKDYINKHFKNNFGIINKIYYPCTHKDAKSHLKLFLKNKINKFGKYQDAISKNVIYGNHSNISGLLNIGLLTPKEVISEILIYFEKSNNKKLIINSIEGIVRQIIGWREYMRFIYYHYNKDIKKISYLKLNNKIPLSWYKGNTDLEILNSMILKVQNFAYLHHIERLMIINNLMILYEIKFQDIYKWFMTCFIDCYDWVMIPNILMNINSLDKNIKYMTRVYLASDNYIKKMSDFNNKDDFMIINKLYWNFLKKNKNILKSDYGLSSQISKLR